MAGTDWRKVLATGSLVAGLLLAGPVAGQTPDIHEGPDQSDYLEQYKRLTEVAAQKMESEVREALAAAQKLTPTAPDEAIGRLRTVLTKLEEDTALTEARRTSLIRQVKDRIRATAYASRRVDDPSAAKLVAAIRRAEDERRTTETANIKRTLDTIRNLQKDGKLEEARRLADDLNKHYPEGLSTRAADRNAAVIDQVAKHREQREDQDRRLAALSREVDKTATPAGQEVEFPRDWAEKTKKRSSVTALTDKEKAILKALNSPIRKKFKDARFEEVIEELSTAMDQPIMLDKAALAEANINYDTPVSLDAKGVAARTALRMVLGQFGLAYIIKDQTIQVTSSQRARDTMVTRVYYLGDLLDLNPFGAARFGAGPVNQLQVTQTVAQIIDLIKKSVEPASWQGEGGGQGSITFNAATMSLVIKQSAEVHAMLSSSLGR